jgi:DNA-binding beta-propeller fold protein YncE
MRRLLMGGVLALCCLSGQAMAQVIVSANDGKQLKPGEPVSARGPDHITVHRATPGGIALLASLRLPTSMIGPPRSVALTPNDRFALITASLQLDGAALVPAATVTLVDLSRPDRPRVVQTIAAGAGASGVAINRAGTLALVANAVDDSVSIFRIARGRLIAAGKIAMDRGSKPVAVEFLADGRGALVVTQQANRVERLAIDGLRAHRHGSAIDTGNGPYSIAVGRDGRFAYVTNLGGNGEGAPGRRIGTIAVIDTVSGAVVQRIDAGNTPEHVALSPGGGFLQATLINGTIAEPGSPNFRDHGLLHIYRIDDGRLTRVAEAETGPWCQGAGWTGDERRVLLQCAERRQIEVYRFDGEQLTHDPAATIQLEARPGAMAVAHR